MAGRIGIMLGLDADGVVVPVDMALLAVNRVRDIVRIELEGRLGGEHHHDDAAVGIIDPGGRSQLSGHAGLVKSNAVPSTRLTSSVKKSAV